MTGRNRPYSVPVVIGSLCASILFGISQVFLSRWHQFIATIAALVVLAALFAYAYAIGSIRRIRSGRNKRSGTAGEPRKE